MRTLQFGFQQFVGIAIAAGQGVTQDIGRELPHGQHVARHFAAVRQGGNGDQGVVADLVAARQEHRAIVDVAVAVLKLMRRLADAEGQLLLYHEHLALQPGPEHEENGGWHRRLIDEAAADADGDVERGPVHRSAGFWGGAMLTASAFEARSRFKSSPGCYSCPAASSQPAWFSDESHNTRRGCLRNQ